MSVPNGGMRHNGFVPPALQANETSGLDNVFGVLYPRLRDELRALPIATPFLGFKCS